MILNWLENAIGVKTLIITRHQVWSNSKKNVTKLQQNPAKNRKSSDKNALHKANRIISNSVSNFKSPQLILGQLRLWMKPRENSANLDQIWGLIWGWNRHHPRPKFITDFAQTQQQATKRKTRQRRRKKTMNTARSRKEKKKSDPPIITQTCISSSFDFTFPQVLFGLSLKSQNTPVSLSKFHWNVARNLSQILLWFLFPLYFILFFWPNSPFIFLMRKY